MELRPCSSRFSVLSLFHERVNDVPVSSTSAPEAGGDEEVHSELVPKWNMPSHPPRVTTRAT